MADQASAAPQRLGEEVSAAEVLAGLAWPTPPAQLAERKPGCAVSPSSSLVRRRSDREDAESLPRKVRVVAAVADAPAGMLSRRTYTWRGICCRRAEKQQRQLEALQQQQQREASPALSSGSAVTALSCPTPTAAQHPVAALAAPASGGGREGDRDWAALTTWLRMNLHNPRTKKRVVQFVGQQDGASGRWAFCLHPQLSWHDVSADTRARLQHLPAEAAKAFAGKYPTRPPGGWRCKSQNYKAPGSSQTHLVLLEDLVLGLHAVWQQHQGSGSSGNAQAGSSSLPCASSAGRHAGGGEEASDASSAALATP